MRRLRLAARDGVAGCTAALQLSQPGYHPLHFVYFFFYFYGDHRDLHSFPTRRSSDLRRRRAPLRLLSRRGEQARRLDLERGREDRKSTRLNSSHSQISYAVFCLKKKKKKKVGRLLWRAKYGMSAHVL